MEYEEEECENKGESPKKGKSNPLNQKDLMRDDKNGHGSYEYGVEW